MNFTYRIILLALLTACSHAPEEALAFHDSEEFKQALKDTGIPGYWSEVVYAEITSGEPAIKSYKVNWHDR